MMEAKKKAELCMYGSAGKGADPEPDDLHSISGIRME